MRLPILIQEKDKREVLGKRHKRKRNENREVERTVTETIEPKRKKQGEQGRAPYLLEEGGG